jgi:hypothetical protein
MRLFLWSFMKMDRRQLVLERLNAGGNGTQNFLENNSKGEIIKVNHCITE